MGKNYSSRKPKKTRRSDMIPVYCPVHRGVFFLKKSELGKPEIKCSVCGAVLSLQPKDPMLYFQSLMYNELLLLLRKLEKELFGGKA